MASNLVNLAAEASDWLKKNAREAFRRTTVARILDRAATEARRGGRVGRAISGLSASSNRAEREMERELRRAFGVDEMERGVAKYAGVGDAIRGSVRSLSGLLKSFATPFRRGGKVPVQDELDIAKDFLRAFGHRVVGPDLQGANQADQRAMAEILQSAGWNISPPKPPAPPAASPAPGGFGGRRRPPRKTTDIDFNYGSKVRVRNDDPLFSGDMIPVVSSNVDSIGFRIEDIAALEEARERGRVPMNLTGTLLIRFKSNGKPLYEYQDVPATLFQAFQRASSKGKFVWENIRVRGTVSGHRFNYDFAGSSSGYVPRQAGLRSGQPGEFYMQRRFNGRSSQLPEQRVHRSGPNRAEPNRGNSGAPNRGSP